MFAVQTITEEILDLKRERRAMILAHHYQDSEIQEIADAIGDSLELSRAAQKFDGEVIAFCGVVFMAETAKVLNPSRMVVLPDLDAGCSLVDACPAAQVRAFRERHPDYVIVSYINTSVEVKAESDILVHLAQRGEDREFDSRRKAHPVPAGYQSGQLREAANRAREHEDLAGRLHRARDVSRAQARRRARRASRMRWSPRIPNALPTCWRWPILSAPPAPSWIGAWRPRRDEFIVMTESGVAHSLKLRAPEKQFYFVPNENCNCSECPYMRRNTLEKLRDALANLSPRIDLVRGPDAARAAAD